MNPGQLETVAVIGNGIIGHGIAQIFAASGSRVLMLGRNRDSLDRAMKKIAASLDDFAAHGLIERSAPQASLARIQTSLRLEDAARAQLVIEAAIESWEKGKMVDVREGAGLQGGSADSLSDQPPGKELECRNVRRTC